VGGVYIVSLGLQELQQRSVIRSEAERLLDVWMLHAPKASAECAVTFAKARNASAAQSAEQQRRRWQRRARTRPNTNGHDRETPDWTRKLRGDFINLCGCSKTQFKTSKNIKINKN